MRYIAAYLLLKIAGNESPTAADVTKVIQSVGIEVEKDRLNSLISELNGKDINAVRFFLTLYTRDDVNVPFYSS
jgi:large subunit ribosomal protein LP2